MTEINTTINDVSDISATIALGTDTCLIGGVVLQAQEGFSKVV